MVNRKVYEELKWEKHFSILQEFVLIYDRVPHSHEMYSIAQYSIGRWCSLQRENHKKGKLSLDRVKRLKTIKHWYWNYSAKEISVAALLINQVLNS